MNCETGLSRNDIKVITVMLIQSNDLKQIKRCLDTKALFPLLYPLNTSQTAQNKAAHQDENSEKRGEPICNLSYMIY